MLHIWMPPMQEVNYLIASAFINSLTTENFWNVLIVIYDLGSGNGKIMIQLFVQYPHLKKLVGVELAPSRSVRGMLAAQRLADLYPKRLVSLQLLLFISFSFTQWIWWNRFTCNNYDRPDGVVSGKPFKLDNSRLQSEQMKLRCSQIVWPHRQTRELNLISIHMLCMQIDWRIEIIPWWRSVFNFSFIFYSLIPQFVLFCVHRTLELRRQDMFKCTDALDADIIICETVSLKCSISLSANVMIFVCVGIAN